MLCSLGDTMKNFIILTLSITLFLVGVKFGGQATPYPNVKVYYIDRTLRNYVPMTFSTKTKNPEKIAVGIISEIAKKDAKSSAISLIPDCKDKISVKIKNEQAYINLNSSLAEIIPKNRETEQLFIYQLVNSICSIDCVSAVRFTIDGQVQKSFLGFFDMREIFTPKDIV